MYSSAAARCTRLHENLSFTSGRIGRPSPCESPASNCKWTWTCFWAAVQGPLRTGTATAAAAPAAISWPTGASPRLFKISGLKLRLCLRPGAVVCPSCHAGTPPNSIGPDPASPVCPSVQTGRVSGEASVPAPANAVEWCDGCGSALGDAAWWRGSGACTWASTTAVAARPSHCRRRRWAPPGALLRTRVRVYETRSWFFLLSHHSASNIVYDHQVFHIHSFI